MTIEKGAEKVKRISETIKKEDRMHARKGRERIKKGEH